MIEVKFTAINGTRAKERTKHHDFRCIDDEGRKIGMSVTTFTEEFRAYDERIDSVWQDEVSHPGIWYGAEVCDTRNGRPYGGWRQLLFWHNPYYRDGMVDGLVSTARIHNQQSNRPTPTTPKPTPKKPATRK